MQLRPTLIAASALLLSLLAVGCAGFFPATQTHPTSFPASTADSLFFYVGQEAKERGFSVDKRESDKEAPDRTPRLVVTVNKRGDELRYAIDDDEIVVTFAVFNHEEMARPTLDARFDTLHQLHEELIEGAAVKAEKAKVFN